MADYNGILYNIYGSQNGPLGYSFTPPYPTSLSTSIPGYFPWIGGNEKLLGNAGKTWVNPSGQDIINKTPSLAEATGMTGALPVDPKAVKLARLKSIAASAAPAVGAALNPLLFKATDHGYDTGGVGQAMSQVGNTVGQIVGQFDPILGAGISAGSGLLGGLYNHSFGTKWNEKGIVNINKDIATTRGVGSGLGGTNVAQDVINASGNIKDLAFTKRDVGKKGWLNSGSALNKKYNTLRNSANAATAYATNAFINAAHNVDRTTDDIAEMNSGKYGTSYAAFGGPLNTIGSNTGMGAIDYGFGMDFMRHLDNKDKMSNKMNVPSMSGTLFNSFGTGGIIEPGDPPRGVYVAPVDNTYVSRTAVPPVRLLNPPTVDDYKEWLDYNVQKINYPNGKPKTKSGLSTFFENLVALPSYTEEEKKANDLKWKEFDASPIFKSYALGGVLQSHGADWGVARHIDAGSTHENNPYEGVPMGMDNEGNPNVVEEGEVIVNDYVFSDRIYSDAETKKMFHISKKRKITFADLAKKLEKEVSERPNDPISKASYKRQITKLQEQQERQKAEKEAAQARVEFDKLSPEEQVALMQEMAAQEQMQQQAMQQPSQEEMMAQQQIAQMQGMPQGMPPAAMGQMSQQATPEEIAQQQMMEQQLGQMAAFGGKLNRYNNGGRINKFAPGGSINSTTAGKTLEEKAFEDWLAYNFGMDYKLDRDFINEMKSVYDNPTNVMSSLYNTDSILGNILSNSDYYDSNYYEIPSEYWGQLYDEYVKAKIAANSAPSFNNENNPASLNEVVVSAPKKSSVQSPIAPVQVPQSTPPPIVAQPHVITSPSAVVSSSAPNIDNEELLKAIYGRIGGIYGRSGFDRWAQKNNVTGYDLDNAQELLSNQSFLDAIKQSDSSLSHVLGDGYDFGLRQLDGTEPVVNTYTGGSWNLDRGYNNYYDSWHVGGDESKWDAAWARIEKEKMWEKLGISDPTQLTRKNIEELMRMTPEYNDTTKLLQENEDLRLRYLLDMATAAEDNPYVSPAAKNYALKFVDPETKTWRPEYKDNHSYETVLQKERENNAGNYWKSIIDKYRNSTIKNWIQNEDGEWELMDVAPPTDWKPTTYNWNSSDGRMTYNYYVDPNSKAGKKAIKEEKEAEQENLVPILHNISKYAGLVGLAGAALPLGMWATGIGKPLDKYREAIAPAQNVALAGYQPIAAPYKYQPQDTFFPSIGNAGIYAAANRNVMNTAAPIGNKYAGLVNSAYNAGITNGDLASKVSAANNEAYMKKALYDREGQAANAQAYNATSQFNANAINQRNQHYANLALNAEAQSANDRAGWYNSLYKNVGNLTRFANDYIRQAKDEDMLARLMAAGVFGALDEKHALGSGYLVPESQESERNKKLRTGRLFT